MTKQIERGKIFRLLHEQDEAFIIPNPWDIGTAKLLAQMNFQALATTSAGYAFSVGKKDNTVEREQMLLHIADIASATDLPVSADLGNCFGDAPETVAETIRLAAETGVVGCSVEDMGSDADNPIYEFEFAVERVRAAAEAAHSLPFQFTLTARTENYLVGRTDLRDTIKRLQAFQEVGADVLFAPGIVKKEEIAEVVKSVDRPVNFIAGLPACNLTFAELSAIGVKRISVGSSLARIALGAFLRVATEMKTSGTFNFSDKTISYKEISAMFDE